jgi:hypothetical protein
LAIQLLETALEREEFEAASELYRFVRSINGIFIYKREFEQLEGINECESPLSPMAPALKLKIQTSNTKAYDMVYLDLNQFQFEVAIHKKAQQFLLLQGYRELLKFSIIFSIELGNFFLENRYFYG